jgi:GNAT superfamily N-acetyltransferase
MSERAEISLRPARPEEQAALEDLQRRASTELEDYREQLEAHPDAIELPMEQIERGAVTVAETNGRIVGFSAVLVEDEHAELDGLFVEPGLWRSGVGRMLVDAAAHEARRRGLALMVVGNPTARGFYERCGFTVEGEVPTRFGPGLRMSR